MKLIITRHGETIENKQDICQGHLPGRLSELGIKQAKKLALRLKDENFDYIYSSDLARALDTAKEIAKYHPDTPLILNKQIRERAFGRYEGKPFTSFDIINAASSDAETIKQLINRTGEFLAELTEKHSDKNILLVGHGGTVGALLANLQNKTFREIVKLGFIKNTSITVFDPVPELTLFNCAKHLDD